MLSGVVVLLIDPNSMQKILNPIQHLPAQR